MGFLSRLLVCIGLSFGLTLLLMVAMYEPEAPRDRVAVGDRVGAIGRVGAGNGQRDQVARTFRSAMDPKR